jgi:hypothetical protein
MKFARSGARIFQPHSGAKVLHLEDWFVLMPFGILGETCHLRKLDESKNDLAGFD